MVVALSAPHFRCECASLHSRGHPAEVLGVPPWRGQGATAAGVFCMLCEREAELALGQSNRVRSGLGHVVVYA